MMQQDITFNTVSATPDDYSCPDGTLAGCSGFVFREGTMQPFLPPAHVATLPGGLRLALVHSATGGGKWAVGFKGDALAWSPWPLSASSQWQWERCPGPVRAVAAVGNTLCAATEAGMWHMLNDGSGYRRLGARPPFPTIRFGLSTANPGVDYDLKGAINAQLEYSADRKRELFAYMTEPSVMNVDDAVYGFLDKTMAGIRKRGGFVMPFFVRYAWRLFDGTHAWLSPPVLLLPNCGAPEITAPYLGLDGDGDKPKAWKGDVWFGSRVAWLAHQVTGACPGLGDWKDILEGVEVFATPPILTYDPGEHVVHDRGVTREAFNLYDTRGGRCLVGVWGDCSCTPPVEDRERVKTRGELGGQRVWLTLSPTLGDDIEKASDFRFLARIPLEKIKDMERPALLEMAEGDRDLNNLASRRRLVDECASWAGVAPRSLSVYNSRLVAGDVDWSPAAPMPAGASRPMMARDPWPEAALGCLLTAAAYSRHENTDMVQTLTEPLSQAGWTPPRWLFHPDPKATRLRLMATTPDMTAEPRAERDLRLEPHSLLNGAFCFAGLGPEPEWPAHGKAPGEPSYKDPPRAVRRPSLVMQSAPGNPFVFPAVGANQVGDGEVLATAAATRAVSQGQFGQYPLYALTSTGVWALATAQDGSFASARPVSRDVMTHRDGWCLLDDSVAFVSARGLMLLRGGECRCASKALDGYSSAPPGLPGLAGVLGTLEMPAPLGAATRLAYDYAGQRLLAFSPGAGAAWALDVEGGRWSAVPCGGWAQALNAWPDTLVVDGAGRVLSLGAAGAADGRAWLLTRPFKLGDGGLKSPRQLIVRGVLPGAGEARWRNALWGTRDFRRWLLLSATASPSLGTLRGSGFKAFRLGVSLEAGAGARLRGFTFSWLPVWGGKAR